MLDAFIIEEIKRRENSKQEREQPVVELPLPLDIPRKRRTEMDREEPPGRGVVVIDLSV